MNIFQPTRLAVKSIWANKLRSSLTMLGVIIGVAAVIALISLGQGSTQQVTERLQSLGTNLLTVNIRGRGAVSGLTLEQSLQFANLPGVAGAAPLINGSVTARHGNQNDDIPLEGTTAPYLGIRNLELDHGRNLTDVDAAYRQRVAIIGSDTADQLFGMVDPVGEKIQLNGLDFTVIGLLKQKGSTSGGSEDNRILIPVTTAERMLGNSKIRTLYIQAADANQVEHVQTLLENQLLAILRDENAYSVFNQTSMLETMSQVTNTLTLMLAGIAGISLLVGGIGIMNIMLVSVTERTREIGIRKAIGARRRDIMRQFLIEAAVLSGLGGLVGIGIGIGTSSILAKVMSIGSVINWAIVALAFGFSLAVGIFFGYYPANRAARLNPIEALRVE